jgi:DNA polymerase III subunit epsilon
MLLPSWLPWRRRHELPAFIQAYEAGPWPEPQQPWREVPYVVLDVETSGLNARRDSLLAIGLVEISEGRIHLDRRWYTLIRPPEGLLVGADSIRIHGLLRAELATAPTFEEVLPALLERLVGRVLIVHVATIDVGFLNRALKLRYGARLCGPILDTARIAVAMHQRAQLLGEVSHDMPVPAIQLRGLAASFGLPVYAQHDALNDALTTAQVFLAQAARLAQQGKPTLKELLRAGGV